MNGINWLEELFREGLKKVDPYLIIKESLRVEGGKIRVGEDSFPVGDIWVVGAGKASAVMGKAVEEILGGYIKKGIIVTKDGHGIPLKYIEVREASHPLPDERGLESAREILHLAQERKEGDTLLVLISGGGSALLPLPWEGITLEEKQEVTRLLMEGGADIEELNTVRKHLSRIKGGRLSLAAYPARIITLAISDVIGDYPHLIASGPTVPDPSTFQEAREILKRRGVWDKLSTELREHFHKGCEGKIPETPKGKEKCWERNHYYILANNRKILETIKEKAEEKGIRTVIISSTLRGEARELAKFYAALGEEIRKFNRPFSPPVLILGGGETTVTVRGKGKGGRNQELALAVSIEGKKMGEFTFLSIGTDGTDGPTDAAGAWVNQETYGKALKKEIIPEKFLENNDSYSFFQKMNSLILTGPTGTNVMDIHLLYLP